MPRAFAVVRLMTNSNLVGRHHWQVSGLLALQDTGGVEANLAITLGQVGAIAHQAAS